MGRRSDHTREQIHAMALESAEQIVDQQGYAGLTARKVVAGFGYTVGTLYLVFRNLEDLVLQVNGRTLDRLTEAATAAAAAAPPGKPRIEALARAYIDFARAWPQRWAMLHQFTLPANPPEWYQERAGRGFALVFEALQPLAPPDQVAHATFTLWGAIHGICMLELTHRIHLTRGESVESLVTSLIDNFLAGLAVRNRSEGK